MLNNDFYYKVIYDYYKDQRAKRSKVPYINHIDEGMVLCEHLGYGHSVQKAFCLHPLFQSDEAIQWSYQQEFVNIIEPQILLLVMEYRNKANAYLSYKELTVDQIELSPIPEVNQMLVVDKVQNRKDFEVYHFGKHERSAQLDVYFRNWLTKLGVSEDQYQELKQLIL